MCFFFFFGKIDSSFITVASRLKVRAKSKGYWLDRENRRQYFTRFADAAGFDVNDLERWRKISIAQITDKMVRTRTLLIQITYANIGLGTITQVQVFVGCSSC